MARDRRAADAVVVARALGFKQNITPEVWLSRAVRIKPDFGEERTIYPLPDRMVEMERHPDVKAYLLDRPLVCPAEWATSRLKVIMRDVSPFELSYLYYSRRDGPLRDSLLVANASGMSVRWIAHFKGLSIPKAAALLEERAHDLWDRHVGFNVWARNLDVTRLPFMEFGASDISLEDRLRTAARAARDEAKVYLEPFDHWRKRNSLAWRRVQSGIYPQLDVPRTLPMMPRAGHRQLRWWPEAPNPEKFPHYTAPRVW